MSVSSFHFFLFFLFWEIDVAIISILRLLPFPLSAVISIERTLLLLFVFLPDGVFLPRDHGLDF